MKQAARWTIYTALFAVPFIPLYVSNELFFPFITGKAFAFRILVEVALAAYLLLAVLDRRYRPQFSWTLLLFAGLVAWMAVANALGVNPHKAVWSNFERMEGWVTLVHALALFLVAGAVFQADRLWRRWWLFFVAVAAIVCGHGMLQLIGATDIHQSAIRLDASLGNAIYLGVYLMFAVFAAAWLALGSSGWLRYALIAFIPLASTILFFTGSRGPLIGLAAGAVAGSALWLFLSRGEWLNGKASVGARVAAGALAFLAVAAGTLFLARESAFVQQDPFLSRAASVYSLGEELQVRSTLWGIALKGAGEQPITGWGQEGFNQVFNKYYDPSLYGQEAWFDRAHNMYLDWLVAGGIPALLLFLALLASCAWALLRAPSLARAERALLIGALAAYAVQALVVFDNLWSTIPLVILLAMAHAASSRPTARLEALPEIRSEGARSIAALAIATAAAATIWTVNVPNIRAANHLVYALSSSDPARSLALFREALDDGSFASQEIREQLAASAARVADDERVPVALRAETVAFAADQMRREVERSPNDARLRVQYAAVLDEAGDEEGALAQMDAAVALSPRKQSIILQRGFTLLALDRVAEAREAFVAAYELDPSFPDLAISAASGLIVSGAQASATPLLIAATGTTTPDSDLLLRAYYQARLLPEFVAVARARVVAEGENASATSRLRYAEALAAANRVSEARAEVQATIAAHPDARAQGEALLARIDAALRPAGR